MRALVLAAVSAAAALLALPALSQPYPYWGYGWGGGHGMMFGGFHFLFWIAVIGFVVWMVRTRRFALPHRDRREDALDILRERFARGEINAEEYQTRRKHLTEETQAESSSAAR